MTNFITVIAIFVQEQIQAFQGNFDLSALNVFQCGNGGMLFSIAIHDQ
jgi:hypothetical protein